MSATPMYPTYSLPELPQWLWDDVLDALYDRANQEWENDRPEVADALTDVADALAKETPVLLAGPGARGEQ